MIVVTSFCQTTAGSNQTSKSPWSRFNRHRWSKFSRRQHYGAKNGQAKAVMTPDGEFPTRSAACSHYKVSRDKFRKWMRDMPKDFFFVNPDDVDATKVKVRRLKAVSTPDGIFPSINSAARHFNVGARTIKTWVRKMRADEFKYVVNSSSSD